jgi:transposase
VPEVSQDRAVTTPWSTSTFERKLNDAVGVIIKYLPPYAPELNLIEILWRFMKYYWLPFSAYASFQCLVEAIEEILTHFGTEYTIAFQAA